MATSKNQTRCTRGLGKVPRAGVAAVAILTLARASFAEDGRGPRWRAPYPPPEVRFEPSDADVSLLIPNRVQPVFGWGYRRGWRHRAIFVRSYTPVCTGPCSARLLPGEYDFALEKNGHVVDAPPVVIQHSSTLEGHYTDRSGTRLAGVLIAVVGITGGAVIMWDAVDRRIQCDGAGYCYRVSDVDAPLLLTGIGVFIGSAVVGSILGWQPDEARITVSPLALAPAAGRRETGRGSAALPDGLAVGLRF